MVVSHKTARRVSLPALTPRKGALGTRVEAVGPKHFAIVAVDHWVMAEEPFTIAGRQLPDVLSVFSGTKPFFYWTIFHITLGFMPKPAAKKGS